jgi:flavin-dependent dehydrogenase
MIDHNYDAIVVGARVAGSAAAILLGRRRLRVLVLDKAAFPSDTLSTHIVLGGGARVLENLGVMDQLEALGGVRLRKSRMRGGEMGFTGELRAPDDTPGLCLGRSKMDLAMLDFARAIDAVEVRENFRVTDLVIEDGAIRGVRGADPSGEHEFRAPLTIGADGMRSTVARIASERVGAFERTDVPCARAYYYGYFTGVREDYFDSTVYIELGPRERGYIVSPCEDGRVVVGTAFAASEMQNFRTDLAANFVRQIRENAALAPAFEGATLASKVFSSGLLLNTYRVPVCDGALLLGDSGLHADPLFGQGHALALISAQIMDELALQWFAARSGDVIRQNALARFTERRDAALKPHYDATLATSQKLGLDEMMMIAWRAAASEQWAADEVMRFSNMLVPPASFPSLRFAALMARHMQGAEH